MTITITKGTKELIKEAIQETQSHNRYVLCESIARTIENRYEGKGKAMDYQLKRMRIQTTGQILEAIDQFFYSYS